VIGAEPSFSETLDWHGGFLASLEAACAALDGPDPIEEGRAGTDFAVDVSWFVNQDYHHYNYAETAAPSHIASLAAELTALAQSVVDSGVTELAGVTTSVCETGASTTWELDGDASGLPDEIGIASYRDRSVDPFADLVVNYPYLYEPWLASGDTALEGAAHRFQARDLWRRLGVALATATHVGWHSHRDEGTSPYRGTGLREESDPSGDLADTSLRPEEAWTRLSYWSLQRLTRLLALPADTTTGAAAGVIPGRMTLPSTAEASYYQTGLDTSLAEDMAVVLEFVAGTVADYVYVVFVDPTAASTLEVAVAIENPGGTVWQVPSVPAGTTRATGTVEGYLPADSPSAEWNVVSAAWGTAQSHIELSTRADADPILLLSSERLTITVSTAGSGA
jgi:hypothetical protein